MHSPDVVLLDRRLPDGDAIDAIGALGAAGARVLVLTGEATATVAARVAEAGGAGLVLKSAGLDELEDAVRRVADGEAVFGAEFLAGVLNRLTGRTPSATLTARERQALGLLADGASTAEVGAAAGRRRTTPPATTCSACWRSWARARSWRRWPSPAGKACSTDCVTGALCTSALSIFASRLVRPG